MGGEVSISKKRARHGQSDVEVTLSIENVPKIHKKLPRIHTSSIPVASLLHPCCILVASSSYVSGFRTPRGTRKIVYNLFMDAVFSDLRANLAQLGPNLDPTWHQLRPTCEN